MKEELFYIDNFYDHFDKIIENTNMLVITSYISSELNPALLASYPKNPLIKDCLTMYDWLYDNNNTYWGLSIVKIMSYIFIKKIKVNNYVNSYKFK